jgi:hypothetical protein
MPNNVPKRQDAVNVAVNRRIEQRSRKLLPKTLNVDDRQIVMV